MNVSQDLLPSLLHTARCFKIKGLDNVQAPPGLIEQPVSMEQQEQEGQQEQEEQEGQEQQEQEEN